jgi:hypothetical protein
MCDITRPRRWRSCYRRHDHQCSTCKERGPANIPSLKNSVLPQLTFSYRLSLPFSLIIMFFFFFFRGKTPRRTRSGAPAPLFLRRRPPPEKTGPCQATQATCCTHPLRRHSNLESSSLNNAALLFFFKTPKRTSSGAPAPLFLRRRPPPEKTGPCQAACMLHAQPKTPLLLRCLLSRSATTLYKKFQIVFIFE